MTQKRKPQKRRASGKLRKELASKELPASEASGPVSAEHLEDLLGAVSRSQQGYRALIDSLDDVVFSLALDGTLRFANLRFAELAGKPIQQLVGSNLAEVLEEPTAEQARKALPELLRDGHWNGVVRLRIRGSDHAMEFLANLHTIATPGANEKPAAISGWARDVTRMRELEARYAGLFESLAEGVYFTTPEGRLLEANPALVQMLGYAGEEELLRKNVVEHFVDPEDRARELMELERTGSVQNWELRLRRKDGRELICLDTASVLRDAAEKAIRYQGTLIDITERREIEQRLHREQEFARRLVEGFPDLIVVLDAEARYTYVSPKIQEVLGYTPQELLGQPLGERTDPQDRDALLKLHQDLMNGRSRLTSIEYRTRHKDGSWHTLRASAGAMYDVNGKVTAVIASSRDVTEFKRLEQQLQQSEKLAAIGQMLAGVAHEMNNPLTAILGVTEYLHERAADEEEKRKIDLARQQARRASNIVQDLLSFARPRSPRSLPVDLREVVRHALGLNAESLRRNDVQTEVVVPESLPKVKADAAQLTEVLLNLLANAEHAIREARRICENGATRGKIRIELGVTPSSQPDADPADFASRRANEAVWITVIDDGTGIDPQILPKIFDPFFTTKRPGRGTGLGLSICLAILREHGGSLEAAALEPQGTGTVFRMTLPVAV